VDVRGTRDRVLALADGADGRALVHDVAAGDRGRSELHQRHRVAVGRLDRHAAPHAGERAGEGHRPRRGRADTGSGAAADVDTAVLARGVRVVDERERPQN
jgi:hypothetical protein